MYVCNASATLIANIFENNYNGHISSSKIVSDISDNFSWFCVSFIRWKNKAMKNRNSWLLKILWRKICQWSQLNWESTVSKSNDNVNKFFSTLYNKLNRTVNKHMLSCVLQMRSHLCFVRAGKSEEQFPKDTVGQLSANSHLTVGCLSANCWSAVSWQTANS